ncbi:MCE family protein [Mycobacterium sp. SMC-4]|uniref:MCE family protein n=1 Tax=Mycobacterium sp. SMC-4 TaxID=2857059 RepID=UPI0021B3B166|nr:MCE family protein [Mycobacterium sp. SMC-4]UXA19813.1 MCE family protein [Mycobacterium sp. SMC-4]
MNRKKLLTITMSLLTVTLFAATVFLVRQHHFGPVTITADFSTATAIYPGDEVRVAGVKVGTISAITPQPSFTRVSMSVDRGVPIPADAGAVIVAPNLISARYVQLTPAYLDSGPQMADGASIPLGKTAVPVEWDEVKKQLTRLATELGPSGADPDTATARFIDSAATAMAGNGDALRQTLTQLSGVGRILAEGSGDIVEVIKNLQTFISTLRASSTQIVQFQDRLATLTSVLDGSRSDLDQALVNVSEVVTDVERFVRGSRNQTAEQIQRLANVTQNVVDHQRDLEQILHVAPTSIANTLNMFDPRDGGATGIFTLSNISNPVQFLCGAIGAIENTTAPETAKLCAQYLGPALRLMNVNYIPLPLNPLLNPAPAPEYLVYTDPALAPGGSGGAPVPQTAPSVSAYTGAGDVAPPPGYGPVPPVTATDLEGLMLPPAAVPPTAAAPPLAAEGPTS